MTTVRHRRPPLVRAWPLCTVMAACAGPPREQAEDALTFFKEIKEGLR